MDDEPRGLNTLKKLLMAYCPEIDIVAECADADMAQEKINALKPELVFLDISLAGKSSFEMLSEFSQIDFEIIFVTAHHEYTLQAFHFSAVDYLVKPIDEDLLTDAVKRAIRRIKTSSVNSNVTTLLHNMQQPGFGQDAKLCIPSLKGFQVVEIKNILYCGASGSYTNFYFNEKNSVCSARPIFEYEDLLVDAGFVRIHKSFLVNLRHIKEYIKGEGGAVILSDGTEIEVSRRKKEDFIARMKTFFKY